MVTIKCDFKAKMLKKAIVKCRDMLAKSIILQIVDEDGFLLPFFTGDIVAKHIWLKGGYESAERRMFATLSRHSNCILDVGANFGLYSLIACQNSGQTTKVIAVEASPREYAKLQLSAAWNKHIVSDRLIILNRAATDCNRHLEIYESLGGIGALNRLDSPAKPGQPYLKTSVEGITLDSLKREFQCQPDLIKLDVEGHELPAIKGSINILETDKPVLMIEMNDKRTSDVSSPGQVWSMLEELGYTWFHAVQNGAKLERFNQPPRFGYLNLFAIHADKAASLQNLNLLSLGST